MVLQTTASLANCLSKNSLGVEDWLEIHWPTQKCALLEAEVMLIDRYLHVYMHAGVYVYTYISCVILPLQHVAGHVR